MHNNLEYFRYVRGTEIFFLRLLSSHIDIIHKTSAFQDIFIKLLFIEYRLSKKITLI